MDKRLNYCHGPEMETLSVQSERPHALHWKDGRMEGTMQCIGKREGRKDGRIPSNTSP